VANTLDLFPIGAVGVIDWLDLSGHLTWVTVENEKLPFEENMQNAGQMFDRRNCADSRLLFLTEFLEPRIIPERIEHRIEPEQRGSERHDCCSYRAFVRDRQ